MQATQKIPPEQPNYGTEASEYFSYTLVRITGAMVCDILLNNCFISTISPQHNVHSKNQSLACGEWRFHSFPQKIKLIVVID